MRQYVMLNATEAEAINYNDVMETSADTLRWNTPKTHTFVKFTGSTPSWLEGKDSYTNAEILSILNNPDGEWYSEPEGF